mmetsp:Transcript_106300/g.307893  ORF Transcript_106300/g.307893 Transcript_106300/m.307893 type:complete len:243 (+) Transcript_106300:2770-3498(+)
MMRRAALGAPLPHRRRYSWLVSGCPTGLWRSWTRVDSNTAGKPRRDCRDRCESAGTTEGGVEPTVSRRATTDPDRRRSSHARTAGAAVGRRSCWRFGGSGKVLEFESPLRRWQVIDPGRGHSGAGLHANPAWWRAYIYRHVYPAESPRSSKTRPPVPAPRFQWRRVQNRLPQLTSLGASASASAAAAAASAAAAFVAAVLRSAPTGRGISEVGEPAPSPRAMKSRSAALASECWWWGGGVTH